MIELYVLAIAWCVAMFLSLPEGQVDYGGFGKGLSAFVGFHRRKPWQRGWGFYLCITHPDVRFWGYEEMYYDGPIYSFGLWLIHFTW